MAKICVSDHDRGFQWDVLTNPCHKINGRFAKPPLKLGRWWVIVSPVLTHWGRVTHICVGKLAIIGSNNGVSPGRRQAIIWTNAGIWLFGPLGTNFNEILIEIPTFSLKNTRLKMSSAKCCPFSLDPNVLIRVLLVIDGVDPVLV